MRKIIALIGIFTILFATDVYCCTSAIITGKATPDGRPLMWKHRDTGEDNNRVDYIKDVSGYKNMCGTWTDGAEGAGGHCTRFYGRRL